MAVQLGRVLAFAPVRLCRGHQASCSDTRRPLRVEVSSERYFLRPLGFEEFSREGQTFRQRSSISGKTSVDDFRLTRATYVFPKVIKAGANCTKQKRNVVVASYRSDDPLYLLGDEIQDGPIELGPTDSAIDPFAVPEASTPQIIASVLLTGTIAVLSFRALRKRARRSKDMQFRSSGVSSSKSVKDEARRAALARLTKSPEIPEQPPTAAQTALGAIVAGVIAFFLYKFATSVEAGFSGKAVSQDYSIRNLTITVRTIITGTCYLATFVFAANSVGLSLYALQLLLGINVSDTPPSKNDLTKKEESAPPADKVEADDATKD